MTDDTGAPGPIDHYLDGLIAHLTLRPDRVRRVLAESEDHLRETAARYLDGGATRVDAERQAVLDFGPARTVARRFAREEGRLLPDMLIAEFCVSFILLAAIGLVAIGVSGAVAAVMGAAFGQPFVAGDAPGVIYTADRCADFLRFHPEAGDCAGAAVAHHYDEVVWMRIETGVLGLLALGGWWLLRRRYPAGTGSRRLPRTFVPTATAALFGVAAIVLVGVGGMQTLFGANSGGAWLSGGIVSTVVFTVASASLLSRLRDVGVA